MSRGVPMAPSGAYQPGFGLDGVSMKYSSFGKTTAFLKIDGLPKIDSRMRSCSIRGETWLFVVSISHAVH